MLSLQMRKQVHTFIPTALVHMIMVHHTKKKSKNNVEIEKNICLNVEGKGTCFQICLIFLIKLIN